jgi:hypothetical protein
MIDGGVRGGDNSSHTLPNAYRPSDDLLGIFTTPLDNLNDPRRVT